MEIGDVVDISIEGVMTTCILISIQHDMKKTEEYYSILEQYIKRPNGWIYEWPTRKGLSDHNHIIERYSLDGAFLKKYSPGYELLIGDKKVWLFFDEYNEA